jgi:hypothetical protein
LREERLYGVLTTIQPPTASVRRLVSCLSGAGAITVVVGDKKGPDAYEVPGVRLLTLRDQLKTPFDLARRLPTGHYSRKNVGYLEAIASGATCLYETDDDNHPLASWAPRSLEATAATVPSKGWFNAYAAFSDALVWPRGFPLDRVRERPLPVTAPARAVVAPIQQGLANGSPDVDAIWRLLLDRDFRFEERGSIRLEPGAWCPFNSQSTWWWPDAFPLLYLPSHCSFRMTDIWRSFVAQRCLWELGHGVVFHAPEVEQLRNEHDLMRDFDQEIPGYSGNTRLAAVLEGLSLGAGTDSVGENVLRCYEALVAAGFVPDRELELVRAWNEDLERLSAGAAGRRQ